MRHSAVLFGNSGNRQLQSRQQTRQTDQIPGQEIAQIGGNKTRRTPVGAAQSAALEGQKRRKFLYGIGQPGPVSTGKRHDPVQGLRQHLQTLSHEGIRRDKQGQIQRMPAGEPDFSLLPLAFTSPLKKRGSRTGPSLPGSVFMPAVPAVLPIVCGTRQRTRGPLVGVPRVPF